jgi:hypothetical protein
MYACVVFYGRVQSVSFALVIKKQSFGGLEQKDLSLRQV